MDALLGQSIAYLRPGSRPSTRNLSALAGWGFRPSTNRPRAIAQSCGLPFIGLEDGFLRSYGTGPDYPALSLVVDDRGIYYAADRSSALEALLESDTDVLKGPGLEYASARDQILAKGLSKYNLAPDLQTLPGPTVAKRVLIIDQTVGDASIKYGLANDKSFEEMLQAAREAHPDAVLYIKTHPEVSGGAKQGYLSNTPEDSHTILLRDPVSPASLLPMMDHVYVVTSHFGFEALLRGIPVTCFGLPWFAGWGATTDRISCHRRTRTRTVDELFAAAYLHYTRYLNPETLERGSIFDVIDWLDLQRRMQRALPGRSIAVGYRRWKAENVRSFLSPNRDCVHFAPDAQAVRKLNPNANDRLIVWGASTPNAIDAVAHETGARLLRMEDGFIRSVGLGSDFVAPHALVMDGHGLYFDARQSSDLETLLNTRQFTERDNLRAEKVRALIVENQLTKYNIEPTESPSWAGAGQRVILVPGQVEDDASIRYGCGTVRDNLSLLQAARRANPDSFLVYKPHPDVAVRNRKGKIHAHDALQYANHIETKVSIVSCINSSDEVHTMTSLSGFDALLRGKAVVTYGMPFYAGWGLTTDHMDAPRRERSLTLNELIAGVMLHYPVYWDWVLNGYTTCETSLRRIIQQRSELLATNRLSSVRKSYIQRQLHKLRLWAKAGFLVQR
ncbi:MULTISPECIES: capsular polysaccharide biosynthesis protein [Achromobacter]|uniref:Capsular polysaccharide biosynthesis protein n=1 Tax=Achromobacter spanius TaxID=217203 RepID=A0ABY8GY40_9BURK|nr:MULTISPECIES: capsular polysaccharide biosynthesis protein [Achromobacter]WAI81358.1 capsular polysaccharide biosynthesis protein [Achromobacter spanius]WEX96876.1 capsular polysaccharide biosynthesis protein [Achromobacter sp. SS2-2022]WFP09409.1 capsular polysaccharide biosynthesis protein [Achromobacter spanius]